MADDPKPLTAGSVLDGKWKIERPLGEGGMGVVYAAAHTRNGLQVAIKVLHPKLAREAAVRERFLYEGYAANRVGHTGTVQVLDDGQTSDGLVYLVMERLVGEAISDRAERLGGALPLEEVVAIAQASLETLAAAHQQGIVHRDFKPENLFITREGALKILDFGLARVRESTHQARLTVEGVLMGTPAFMPPEQAQATWDQVDARSDVYSVGASMWTLATGRLVHEGATALQILVKVSTQPAEPLRSFVPRAPEAIAAVVDKALAKPRHERWADADAMLDALRSAVEKTGFKVASLRQMSGLLRAEAAAPNTVLDPPRATGDATGANTLTVGTPLESDAADSNDRTHVMEVFNGPPTELEPSRPPNMTVDPTTPRMEHALPPERGRAMVVGLPGNAAPPMPYAPTMLPGGTAPPTYSAGAAMPAGAQQIPNTLLDQSNAAALAQPGLRTVSPTSSDASPGRRSARSSTRTALVVSASLVGFAVVSFIVVLLAFRDRWRGRPSEPTPGAEPPASSELHPPATSSASSESVAPPGVSASAAATGEAASSASAVPAPSSSAKKRHPPTTTRPPPVAPKCNPLVDYNCH